MGCMEKPRTLLWAAAQVPILGESLSVLPGSTHRGPSLATPISMRHSIAEGNRHTGLYALTPLRTLPGPQHSNGYSGHMIKA